MAVSARQQVMFWGAGLVAFGLFLWVLGGVMLPFIAGAAIAYLLDPLADRLERAGMSRVTATLIITAGAVIVIATAMLTAIPALIGQASGLIRAVPGYMDSLGSTLVAWFPDLLDAESDLSRRIAEAQERIAANGLEMLNSVLASSMRLLDVLVIIVVTPVVAFYLLLDWDHFTARIDSLLPRSHAPVIRRLAGEIDAVLAGFVRGQSTVCLLLGLFYALALMLVGLPYGFLIGIVAGFLSFIPYVGSFVGGVMSIGVALFTFWDEPLWILAVAAIFALGQFVEGNVLSPNLIGRSVRLHPVWLIFALSVFGSLFGFVGMLVAVPVAAALGVLTRFAVDRYLASPLYSGRRPDVG
jgi:predicted PurR-regulated permease PerM